MLGKHPTAELVPRPLNVNFETGPTHLVAQAGFGFIFAQAGLELVILLF